MTDQIKLRRDSATAWSTTNPTLAAGEAGVDLTNNAIKVGTGSIPWNSQSYVRDPGAIHYSADDAPTSSQLTAVRAMLGVATDTAVTHKASTETISGAWTFSTAPTVPTPTATGHAATKGYVDTAVSPLATDSAVTHKAGTETISGTWTFSASPTVPTPTSGTQAANKSYVDSLAGGSLSLGVTMLSGLVASSGTTDNATYLNNIVTNHPGGDATYLVPDAPSGMVYGLGATVVINKSGIHFQGNTLHMNLSSSANGGATFKDKTGLSGAMFQVGDATTNPDHVSFEKLCIVATHAQYGVLDSGAATTLTYVGIYNSSGTSTTPSRCYDGKHGPNGGQARSQLYNCTMIADGDPANQCLYLGGTDFLLNSGRYTGGAKIFDGTGHVVGNAHFTSDSVNFANLHNLGAHNTYSNIQIDSGQNFALLYSEGQAVLINNIAFYALRDPNAAPPTWQVPLCVFGGSYGPQLLGANLNQGGTYPPWTYFINYALAPGSTTQSRKDCAATTQVKNVKGLTLTTSTTVGGNINNLWDIQPGDFNGLVGADVNGNKFALKGTGPNRTAKLNKFSDVTFATFEAATSGQAGSGLAGGTLYLAKMVTPDSTVSAIARDWSAAWTGQTGIWLALYESDGTTLTLRNSTTVGTGTGYGAVTLSPTVQLVMPERVVYVGLMFTGTVTAGGFRVPPGGLGGADAAGANKGLVTGTDELAWCIGATGLAGQSSLPATINVSALLPAGSGISGPPWFGLKP